MYISHSALTTTFFYLLYSLNLIFHSIGTYFLITVHRRGRKTVQNLCLMNLGVLEIIKSIMNILGVTTSLRLSVEHVNNKRVWQEIWTLVVVINAFGLNLWQYTAIIFITLDRLFLIVFSSYQKYWTIKKTKYLICMTWLLGIIGCAATYMSHKFNNFNNEEKVDIYIKTGLDFIFVVVSLTTYILIFRRYISSHQRTRSNSDVCERETAWQLFRKTRFFIAIGLISSFFLFMAIPDITLTALILMNKPVPDTLLKAFLFLGAISDLIDALIYIFMRDEVRERLLSPLEKYRHRRKRQKIAVIELNEGERVQRRSRAITALSSI